VCRCCGGTEESRSLDPLKLVDATARKGNGRAVAVEADGEYGAEVPGRLSCAPDDNWKGMGDLERLGLGLSRAVS
jgi:hypothetical protein